MIFIAESELLNNKQLFISLTAFYGINKNISIKICKILGFSKNFKTKNLSTDQKFFLDDFIKRSDIRVNSDLKKFNNLCSNKLLTIKCYRGLRKLRNLPVRGQRTRTNSKTSKRL